uniref:LRRCT domain-containing protein n=1 Tax=Chrysemys picta bellii TaxID=8478 RepID=A0A8C3FL69_CHRPI
TGSPTCWTASCQSLWKLQVLLLSGNYITEVGERAFSSLERLQKLDIHRNEITVLGSSFSTGLTSLRELNLSYNRLQELYYRNFQHFENLQKLSFQNNNISSIEMGAFRSLTRLRKLHLQNNHLLNLPNGVFSMLHLTVLNLVHNEIEHIRFKTFLTIQTPGTHILLSYNPWICDCDLQRVFAKLHSVKRLILDDYDNMTCMEPQVLRNLSLSSVDTQLCVAETVTVLVITFTVVRIYRVNFFSLPTTFVSGDFVKWSESSDYTYLTNQGHLSNVNTHTNWTGMLHFFFFFAHECINLCRQPS